MARPLWYKFLGQSDHPMIDQMQALFATNHTYAENRGVARLLQQLLNTAPPPPVRTDAGLSPTPAVVDATSPLPTPGPDPDPVLDATPSDTRSDGPAVPAPIEVEGDHLFALQVGRTEPLRPGTPQLIVAEVLEQPAPLYGGGWAADYIANHTYSLPLRVEFDVTTLPDPDAVQPSDFAPFDTLELSGDFSAGLALSNLPFEVDQVVLMPGSDYALDVGDDYLAAHEWLGIDGRSLGDGHNVVFDGSAETDGSFAFYGSDADDAFTGGAGDDVIRGGGGADILSGGGGADLFVYGGPGDSTAGGYDTLVGFDAAADRINLPGSVSGFAASVQSGSLSQATLNTDLSAALGGLGALQAAWFAPDAGDLAGQTFLIVDANGVAGYQAGADYLLAITGTPLADLIGHTDIFV